MKNIYIIVATIHEAKVFKGLPFLISISGIGKDNAYRKAKNLIEKGASLLISSGMSTALSAKIGIGYILIPDMILSSDGKKMQVEYNKRLRQSLKFNYIFSGPLLETEKVITGSAEKRKLYKKTGCIASDMESGAILRAANESEIPFVCVRSISDSVDMDIPKWLLDAVKEDGSISSALLIKGILLNPFEIYNFIRLIRGFYKAKNSLRQIMSRIYPSLPF